MEKHIVQITEKSHEGLRTAPAATRNTGPLIDALRGRLPAQGRVLEVASGTGQHVAAFGTAFPDLSWLPSDVDPMQRKSIDTWRRVQDLSNVSAPLALDIDKPWPVARGYVDVVLTINLLHLVPVSSMLSFFDEGRSALNEQGRLIIYGPFLRGSSYASEGDRYFDISLREQDPAIGYKSVEQVTEIALKMGLVLQVKDTMPANNLLMTFQVSEY